MGADCKSAGLTAYGGSNPPRPTRKTPRDRFSRAWGVAILRGSQPGSVAPVCHLSEAAV